MDARKVLICVGDLYYPGMTPSFQEKICRIVCEKENLINITVKHGPFDIMELDKILFSDSIIVTYSLLCLSNSLDGIKNIGECMIKKRVDLISVTDPVDQTFKRNNQIGLVLRNHISSVSYLNEVWKELSIYPELRLINEK